MTLAFEATNLPVEGAAAAGIAALVAFGDEIPGERVGVLITGGRVSRTDLVRVLS
jgi:threonine dehydratase